MQIGYSLRHNLKWLFIISGLLIGLITSFVFVDYALAQSDRSLPDTAENEHVLNIYDRGQERVIITKAKTIRQALKSAQIDFNIGWDVVEPGLDTKLIAAKYNVNIYRAKPITIVDGTVRKRVTTAQQTPELIAKAADIKLYTEDEIELGVASDHLIDGIDTIMEIDRATPFDFNLYGKQAEVRTQANTVGEFLKERGIKLGSSDTLSVDPSTPITAGMSVSLWRDGKQTVTQEEEVDFPIEKIDDANQPVGYKEVKTPGEKGTKNVTYEIEMRNGEEVSRKEIASVTTKEPKKQVEVVGAKLPTPTNPSESAQLGRQMMLGAGFGEDQWPCLYNLWNRESGWRTTAGNPSSGAYGIPQSLPASKMASHGADYLTNPATQISWGLSYIKGRYGTPCGAWGHFQSKNWY